MNSTPAANDPIVRIMRDTCAHFTESARNAGLLAPILLLLADAFALLFGKLENILLLWRAGALPPPAPKPLRVPRARHSGPSGQRRTRTSRRTPALRLRRPRITYPHPRASIAHPNAPNPRIDRYPKPAPWNRPNFAPQTCA